MPKFIRKRNRLPYSEIYKSNNSFFVTICVQDRVCCLSEIRRGMPLASHDTENGQVTKQNWQASHASTQNNMPTFQWQKSFYDHVIRNEQDFERVREYIYNNPLKWKLDLLNPINNEKYQKWLLKNKNNA